MTVSSFLPKPIDKYYSVIYNNDRVKKERSFEMQNNEPNPLQKEAKEIIALLEKCQPEQKNYIAGVIDGMNAERRLSADTRSA